MSHFPQGKGVLQHIQKLIFYFNIFHLNKIIIIIQVFIAEMVKYKEET